MNVNRQIAQHQARIRMMQRQAIFGGAILAVLLALCASAFVFEWHVTLKVLLIVPPLGTLLHAAAPYTRIRDHRQKIRELEDKYGVKDG